MSPPMGAGKRWAVAETPRTRPDIPAPTTVAEFMALLARGLDESHAATRGGHR